MKKSFFNLLLVSFVSFSVIFLQSCGKDEDDAGSIDVLLGTWTATSADFSFTINGIDFITWVIQAFELTQEEANEFLALFESDFDGDFATGTITFKNDNTYSAVFGGEAENGIWSRSGNTLTLTDNVDNDSFVLTIATVTSKNLSLEFKEQETEDFDEDGTDDVIEIHIRLNFSK